jgi:hypothetical protein
VKKKAKMKGRQRNEGGGERMQATTAYVWVLLVDFKRKKNKRRKHATPPNLLTYTRA